MKTKTMSLKEYYEKHMTLEKMEAKWKAQDEAMEQMQRIMDYCLDNKCSFDDLIDAHKKLKNENI